MGDQPSSPEQTQDRFFTRRKVLASAGVAVAAATATTTGAGRGGIGGIVKKFLAPEIQPPEPVPPLFTVDQFLSLSEKDKKALEGKGIRIEGTPQHLTRARNRFTNLNYTTGIPVSTGAIETITDYFILPDETNENGLVFSLTQSNPISTLSADSNVPENPYENQIIQISGFLSKDSAQTIENILKTIKPPKNVPIKLQYYINGARIIDHPIPKDTPPANNQ